MSLIVETMKRTRSVKRTVKGTGKRKRTRNAILSLPLLLQMALSLLLVLLLTSCMKLPTVLSFSPTPSVSTYHQYYHSHHQQQNQQRNYHQHTQSSPIVSLQMMDMSDIISTTTSSSITIDTITNTITNTATTSSSILNAVETFDGSLVKPTVVSNAYWTNIQSNIGRVIIGQAIATVIFAILTFFISTQDISDFVAKNVFNEDVAQSAKANVNQFKKSVKTRVNSPTVTPNLGKLLLCLTIDTIGTTSQLVPIIGELTDFVWAPIAALTLRSIFQGSNVVFALEFVEEFLPFTDILPLATICWIVETFFGDTSFAKSLQIGNYGKNVNAIDFNSNVDADDNVDAVPFKDNQTKSK